MNQIITEMRRQLVNRAIDKTSASKSLFLKKLLESHIDTTADSSQKLSSVDFSGVIIS